MTDKEFLDDLEDRAAKSVAPIMNWAERCRLATLAEATCVLSGFFVGRNYTVATESLNDAVCQARRRLIEAVTRRLKA